MHWNIKEKKWNIWANVVINNIVDIKGDVWCDEASNTMVLTIKLTMIVGSFIL